MESQAPVLERGGCLCTQVIVAIMDNWQSTGGVDEYVSWTGDANLTHGDFYTNKQCQRWYIIPALPSDMHASAVSAFSCGGRTMKKTTVRKTPCVAPAHSMC